MRVKERQKMDKLNLNLTSAEVDAMTKAEYLQWENKISMLENNTMCYNNFENMMNDMKEHVRSSGHTLASADIPKQLKIGFIDDVDQSKWFTVRLVTFHKWIKENTIEGNLTERAAEVRRAFSSPDGRIDFIKSIK